jgi:leader peptidase (prepilin peptidase)/N-methyltransferase
MTVIVALLCAALGFVVGAVAVHGAEALMAGRSELRARCPYCETPYLPRQWSATVALLSGSGRCRQCAAWFRVPRLLGELFVAVNWGLLVGRYGLRPRVGFAMLAVLPLAMILVTDLETKRVPNVIILPAIAVMLVLGGLFGPALPTLTLWRWWDAPLGGLVGFGVLRLLVSVGVALFGEGAMGEGDITLATYVGLVVGFPIVVAALILGFLFGGVGALLVLLTGQGSMKTAIPYGPFIILGCSVALLWGPDIVHWFLY